MMKRTLGIAALILLSGAAAAAQDPASTEWRLQVVADGARVRVEAREASATVVVLARGAMLVSHERLGDWYRVAVETGEAGILRVGYVAAADVQVVTKKTRPRPDFWAEETGEFRGIGLGIRIVVGMNGLSGGDLRPGSQGLLDAATAAMEAEGWLPGPEHRDRRWLGSEWGLELSYRLTPRLSLGLGLDYCFENSESAREVDRMGMAFSLELNTHFAYLAPRLGLIYTRPLGRGFSAYAQAGAWLPVATYSCFAYSRDATSLDVRSRGLGICGALGFEAALTPRAAVFIEARGRYGRLRSFQGEEIWQPAGAWKGDRREGTLYCRDEGEGRILFIRSDGEAIAAGSEAVLSLRSVGISAGLQMKFQP